MNLAHVYVVQKNDRIFEWNRNFPALVFCLIPNRELPWRSRLPNREVGAHEERGKAAVAQSGHNSPAVAKDILNYIRRIDNICHALLIIDLLTSLLRYNFPQRRDLSHWIAQVYLINW